MRILFFIDCLVAGGKERRLIELLKEIKSVSNIEFSLAVMSDEIHYKELHNLNVRIHYLIRNSKRDISVLKRLYKLCRQYRPDIIHCWDGMTAIYSVPVCKLLNIRLVNGLITNSYINRNIFNKFWIRAKLTFAFSDIIVSNSNAGLIEYRAPKSKSVCIYNGLDLKRFTKLKDPLLMKKELFGEVTENYFVVGMVAAFEERKDYNTFIKAAVSLLGQIEDFRFLMVGDGTYFQDLKKDVPVSFSERIVLTGRRSDIESIVNIFDVGVLLTNSKVHGEGISNSILEYMALGKPVIATSGGGTIEVVNDEQNGFLIEAFSVEQLQKKILVYYNNREIINKFGMNGKQLVHEKFNINIMTEQFIKIYQNVAIKK